MAVDFSALAYTPAYNVFARPVTITPIASQPGQPAYGKRGIFDTRSLDAVMEGGALLSDQQTILDILESEFSVLPIQRDRVFIPAHMTLPEQGLFEVIDASTNGGGETTLELRKVVTPNP